MTRGCLNIALHERISKHNAETAFPNGNSCSSRSSSGTVPLLSRRSDISARLGRNMWKSSRSIQAAYCQFIYIFGFVEKKKIEKLWPCKLGERRKDRRVVARDTTKGDNALIISRDHRRDSSLQRRRKFLPGGFCEKRKKEKSDKAPSSPVPPIRVASARVCPICSLPALYHHQRHVLTWE